MPAEDENCYKLSRVLCEEFEALRPGCFANVDTQRDTRDEKQKRQDAYKVAHNLGLSALALSGGGIRSDRGFRRGQAAAVLRLSFHRIGRRLHWVVAVSLVLLEQEAGGLPRQYCRH